MLNKLWIIAKRECLVRMNKRSFWLLALLGPLILLLMSVVPYAMTSGLKEEYNVLINVPNECFDQFPLSIGSYQTNMITTSTKEALQYYYTGEEQVLCDLTTTSSDTSWTIYSKNKIAVVDSLNLTRILTNVRLSLSSKPITTSFITVGDQSQDKNNVLQQTIALVCALIVYLFLFTYSASLLKGVMEEKSNKVMDIILSTVSPFTWLLGKISGVGLASVLQFSIWICVSYVPYYFFDQRYGQALDLFSVEHIHATVQQSADPAQALAWHEWIVGLQLIPWVTLFCVMFISMSLGFVLYAAVFSMVGILVDREADTQPYILPITSPLLLSFFTSGLVMADPAGDVAVYLSYIPFTAPVILPLRVALGIPFSSVLWAELFLGVSSVLVLFVTGMLYKRVLNKGGNLF